MNLFRLLLPIVAALLVSACSTLPSAPTASDTGSPALDAPPSVPGQARLRMPSTQHTGPLLSLKVDTAKLAAFPVATLEAPKDIWERIRRGYAMPDLENALVRDREQWYASRPDYMQRMTERGSKYLFHIVEELERRNLPLELALLPFIESAFNPQAVSHAKAAGMWQFMPATGRDCDLKQNAFRDDRRDVLASTRAALDYLERLHRMFGDWHLALAAYNWGEGSVSRAIQRNRAAGLGTSYEELRMPEETRYYVPKLQAVKNIVLAPQRFNVTLAPIGNHPFFDAVTIDRDIDVALVAELANVSERDFRQLNPSHNKPVIMAAGTPTILLPWDNALLFQERLRAHTGPLASWTAWRVPSQMTVAAAAKQHGISEAELRDINRIPPRMALRAGSTVLVPRQGKLDADVPEHIADNGQILFAPERAAQRTTRVKVRSGDTLASVARRHRVSVADLTQWNNLRPNASLKSGQTLKIVRDVEVAAASTQSKGSKAAGKTRATPKASGVRTAAANPGAKGSKAKAASKTASTKTTPKVSVAATSKTAVGSR